MKRKYLGDSQSDIEKINKKTCILHMEEYERKLDNDEFIQNKRLKLMEKDIKELNIIDNSISEEDEQNEFCYDDIPSIKINHPEVNSDIINFNEHSLEDSMYSVDEVITIMRQYKSNVIRELEKLNIRHHVKKYDLEGIEIY